ncbi:MAG: hypothetical protein IH804_01915, partial [Planctomycetes bacterium]|nr:hypothetical protein [Planctomycetota bacterium]
MAWLDALIGLGIGILLGAAGAAWLGLLKRNRLVTDLHNACGRVELLEEERRSRAADEGRLKDAFGALFRPNGSSLNEPGGSPPGDAS